MKSHSQRERPIAWSERKSKVGSHWVLPFAWVEHKMDWIAYLLANWSFLEVLAYLESFGVLIAVIFYFSEAGDRLKQKHYQAWQVINSAQGKGGNGGRIDALEVLNADGVPLVGVDLSGAFLVGIRLPKADLARADFNSADARQAQMPGAKIEDANLRSANFRGAGLEKASLQGSVLDDGDFSGANLRGADLSGVSLVKTDLQGAQMAGIKWETLKCIDGANLSGVKSAPKEFLNWALAHGATEKRT